MSLISFFAGLFLGGTVGALAVAIVAAGRESDNAAHVQDLTTPEKCPSLAYCQTIRGDPNPEFCRAFGYPCISTNGPHFIDTSALR